LPLIFVLRGFQAGAIFADGLICCNGGIALRAKCFRTLGRKKSPEYFFVGGFSRVFQPKLAM